MTSAETQAQKLLALMGELAQSSDREYIITRFMKVFRDLWPEARGHITQETCAESCVCLPITAGDSRVGALMLDDAHDPDEEELALIRPALSLLGLILNTQEQHNRLTAHKPLSGFESDAEKADRQSIETRLQESQAHFSAIFNHTRDLQLLAKYEGPQRFRIVEINHAYIQACNQYGLELTAADFIGRTLEDVIVHILGLDENIAQYTVNNYQQAIDTGEAVRYDESVVVLGKPYHSSITLSPIRKTTENHYYVAYSSHDITAQKEAEIEIQRLKSFFEHITENVQDGIWVTDRHDVIFYVNRGMEDIAGVPKEQLVGKNVLEDFPQATTEKFNVFYRHAKHDLTPTWYEVIVKTPAGRNTWQNGWLVPILRDGRFDGMICTIRDVTERKDAERKLEHSEARYKQLVETASDAIYLMDERGIIIDTNRMASQMLRKSREEIVGSLIDTVDPNFPVDAFLAFWNTVPYGEQQIFETTHITKHGDLIPIEISGKKFQIDEDTYYFGVARNISARKTSEKELKRQRDFLELIMNSVPTRIFWKDRNCVYLGCNVHFAKDAGLETPEEIVGKNDDILVWNANAETFRADDQRVMRTGNPKLQYEEEFLNRDGDKVVWRTSKMPLRNADGGIIGVVATSEDITEEKRAADELYASEAKFRSYIDNAPDGIFIADEHGKYLQVNQAACDITGYSRQELLTMAIPDLLAKEDVEKGGAHFQETRKAGSARGELGFVTKRGEKRFWHVAAVKLSDTRYLGFVKDITERKHAEEEVQTREEQYRFLAENTSDLIVQFDAAGQFQYISPSVQELTGYTPEEYMVFDTFENIYPDDRPLVERNLQNIAEGAERTLVECRIFHKSGHVIWIQTRSRVIRDSRGTITSILSTSNDITERKQAVKTLQERNAYIETIMENMPIGFALNTIDDGDVKYMNSLFEEIYGWPREVLTNSSIFFEKVFPDPAFREEMRTKILADMQSGDPERMRWNDLKIVTSRGEVRYVYAFNIPLHDQNLMISTVQDVTERNRAQEQVLQSLREKETLLRELYHRTKNNMNVIQSMLMLQASFSRNAEVERIAKEVGDKIQAMALVHQKLYQSQNLSRIPFHEYLPELVHLLQQSYSIAPSRIAFNLDIAPVFALIDTAIPCGLVLNELISNTFKHAFPDGRSGEVQIQLTEDEQGLITLQVSDNGVGVPPGFDFRAQDSLGLQSIVMIAEHQLRGSVLFTVDHGVSCRVQFTDTSYQERV